MSIGAWANHFYISQPELAIETAKKYGVTRLSWILNDASDQKQGNALWHPFIHAPNMAKILDLTENSGIEPHVMVWAVRDAQYLDNCAKYLYDLKKDFPHIRSVHLDVEGPWCNRPEDPKRKGVTHEMLVKTVLLPAFKGALDDTPMAATGIVYTPKPEFGAVAKVMDYLIPQAYTTSNNKSPRQNYIELAKYAKERYSDWDKSIELGICGYDTTSDLVRLYKSSKEPLWSWSLHQMDPELWRV